MKFERRLAIRHGGLDMTPLIDVVFNLLIFFMLSSSFIFNPGVRVDLPEYWGAEHLQPSDIVLTMTDDNRIYLREKFVSTLERSELLREEMRRAAGAAPGTTPRLIIKADAKIPFGRVVNIMSMAKEEGFQSQAIATRPRRQEEAP